MEEEGMPVGTDPAAGTASTRCGEDGVPNPVLHHINLKTTRLDQMIEWYGMVTGMRVNFRAADLAFLSNDDANHRLALIGFAGISDDPKKIAHAGLHHSAFEFTSMAGLLRRYRTLKDAGVTPHMCLDHGLTMSFYYQDPDGNSVELQSDNFSDWNLSTEWIRTAPEFVADPIGKFVDPDALWAALESGLTHDEIHRRAYAGEYPPSETPDLMLPPSDGDA